jgi:hypothetical protein
MLARPGVYFSKPVPAEDILAIHRRATLTVADGSG